MSNDTREAQTPVTTWKLRRAIEVLERHGDEHGVAADLRAALATQPAQPSAQGEAVAWPYVEDWRFAADRLQRALESIGVEVVVDHVERAVHRVFIEKPSKLKEPIHLTEPACHGNGGCCPDDKCEKWVPRASAPAAPAQAVPLTDEQIDLIERRCCRAWMESHPPLGGGYCSPEAQRVFARAIERAHGIKAAP